MEHDIDEEIEVLRAIYDKDFENRPPVWNRPSFAIHIQSTSSSRENSRSSVPTVVGKDFTNIYS